MFIIETSSFIFLWFLGTKIKTKYQQYTTKNII